MFLALSLCESLQLQVDEFIFFNRSQMFKLLSPSNHTIVHNTNSKLLKAIPLSHCVVVLFFKNGEVVTYDLLKQQFLGRAQLNRKVYQAKAISDEQICCTFVDSLTLSIFNRKTMEMRDLQQLPIPKAKSPNTDHQTFFLSYIEVFRKSGTFYLRQHHEATQITIFYFQKKQNQIQKDFVQRSLSCTGMVVEPVNDQSTIAVYKQYPNTSGRWNFKMYNLAQNFKEQEYQINHPNFAEKSLVQKVAQYQPNRYLIFSNNMQKPFILIFDANINEVFELLYKPQANFTSLCLLNPDQGFMCFSTMFKEKYNGKYEQYKFDVVSIESGKRLDSKYGNLANIDQAWGRNYFLDWDRDKKQSNTSSTVTTWSVISKQSMYMNLLHHSNVVKDYGEVLCLETLRLLD